VTILLWKTRAMVTLPPAMRSEERPWRYPLGVGLLIVLLIVALVLLVLTEQNYTAFREALQGIQFTVSLTHFEQLASQEARLQWTVTVTMPAQKIPASLELLDWHLYSADRSTYLGYYTSGDVQIALGPNTEIPLEAAIRGPNFEKLQRLQEESPQETALLFQGVALVMFQLPQREERKKFPVASVFMLPKEGE